MSSSRVPNAGASRGADVLLTAPEEEGARGRIYAWLAEAMRSPPTVGTLARLAELPCAAVPEGDLQTPLQLAVGRLQNLAAVLPLTDLDDEYHALFIGLGRGELVPYASWYLTGFVMGRPLASVRADLAALGIARRQGVCEPEDHGAALCETMALLSDTAEGVSLRDQYRFHKAHVMPWMGLLFKDMQSAPSARFYAAVGELGEAFLDLEQHYLDTFATFRSAALEDPCHDEANG